MAAPYRIVRNSAGNCIEFRGSSQPVYWNACLSGQASGDNVSVVNDVATNQGAETVYEFFEIPYTDFVDEDGVAFPDAVTCAAYITGRGNVLDQANATYQGVWNASTNTPDLSASSPAAGDFYFVSVAGSTLLDGESNWKVNDRVMYNGTAWERIAAVQLFDSTTRSVLLNTQTSVFADGEGATADPDGASPGWYYRNSTNQKINWYFYGDSPAIAFTKGDFGGWYAVIDFKNTTSRPFWNLYTLPQGDGEDQSWYRSRITYADDSAYSGISAGRYLVHSAGLDVSAIEPLLPRISLGIDSATTIGLQADTEELYLMALSTSSGLAEGSEEFRVEKVAYKLGTIFQEYQLSAPAVSSPSVGSLTPTSINFLRDETDTTILADDGTQYGVNSIRAIANGDGSLDIQTVNGDVTIYENVLFGNVQIAGAAPSSTENGVVNALNALFEVQPLGAGGDYAPTYPLLATTATTGTLAEGITPSTTKSDNTTLHLYVRDSDSSGHGARYWSNETIDVAGEYFTVKITGNGRFIIGFADGTTDSDGSGTADDLEELANNTGSAASGMVWSQAIYDYGSYTAPWTWYGSSSSGSYGPGWNGAITQQMRHNSDVQTAIATASGSDGALFKAGIDQNGYFSVWYFDSGRSNDWILCSRRSLTTDGSKNYHLVVKLWDGNTTLVEYPEIAAADEAAPVLTYRYIESPDGSFHYPLFATQEEANYVDTENGGGGSSTGQIFIDEPTNSTWYAPDTGYTSGGASAPADTAEILYTEIPTNADALYAPTQFSRLDVTVDEQSSLNIAINPADHTWTTSVSISPSLPGLVLDSVNMNLTGTAPEVTGDNVTNPSDTYTVTVTRSNAYGSSVGSFDIVVNNLTAPSTAVSGFTWDATSTPLVDSDTMADGSVVTLDNTLEEPRRYIFEKSWVEANVLPALQESGDAVWLGVKDGAGVLTDGVAAADFDAYIKWEWVSSTSHTSEIGAGTTSTQTINSLTDAFYDYAFEADDAGSLHVIACNVNSINSEPGVAYGGGFSRTVSTTGTDPYTLSMVTVGTEMDLSTTGVSEIIIPQAPRWIQVRHTQGGHVLEFKQTGDAAFSGTMPTLQAGYTYRFLVNGVYWADQSTNTHLTANDILRFTADGSTEYTTGITRSGAVNDEFAYVEFAVPSDVPPLQWYNDQAGIGTAAGINISGSTYVVPVTGITLEGPVANQTGSNLFDQPVGGSVEWGWLSIDEQLGAGQRLVLDNAFLADLTDAMPDDSIVFLGLKDGTFSTSNRSNSGGSNFEGGAYFAIYRYSAADIRVFGYVSGATTIGRNFGTNGISNQGLELALDLTNSGNNIRLMLRTSQTNSSDSASATAYADWSSSYKTQTGDQGYGLTNVDVVVLGDGTTQAAAAMDSADVDWTGLSEISVPTPAVTLTTPWTKALDFSGSAERIQQVDAGNNYAPIKMGGTNNNVPEHSSQGSAYTSDDTNSRPWATAVVFSADGNSSNQHIWNCGEGSGSTDDNIYLRLDASRNLYFGWGRSGELNEVQFGFNLSTSQWYGVYIASTGERLGSGHAAGDIADCFDIRFVDLSTGAVGSNLSTYANWSSLNSSFGARMNRQIAGGMTIGGRGANRNFHGKVAAMVVTTLRRGQQMPQAAEISMMVRDPQQWMTDYKVGVNYRSPSSSASLVNWQKNSSTPAYSTQVWLMGDGQNDAYAQIRNNVYPAIQNIYPMNMISMVSNDIQTVTINGLS